MSKVGSDGGASGVLARGDGAVGGNGGGSSTTPRIGSGVKLPEEAADP